MLRARKRAVQFFPSVHRESASSRGGGLRFQGQGLGFGPGIFGMRQAEALST